MNGRPDLENLAPGRSQAAGRPERSEIVEITWCCDGEQSRSPETIAS
jgi:hypothetical protein